MPVLWNCANLLTQKIVCPTFTADFAIDISGLQNNSQAGILMLGGEYCALAFQKAENQLQLIYLESETKQPDAAIKDTNTTDVKLEHILYSTYVDFKVTTADLRIVFGSDKVCRMYYKLEADADFTRLPFSFTPKGHTWVGARIGMFSTALDLSDNHGFADFTNVTVTMLPG